MLKGAWNKVKSYIYHVKSKLVDEGGDMNTVSSGVQCAYVHNLDK